MKIICLLLYLPQFVGALQVETALFEVPVKSINEDIKTLQRKIKDQKAMCLTPPSTEWCDKNTVKHEGWNEDSDFGIAICGSTIWDRENHYNGLHLVEQELDVIALTFENCLIMLGLDIEELSKVEKEITKDLERIPSFKTINYPKLRDDNGNDIVMDEISNIFSSGEKMLEDFEKGNYKEMLFTFGKQIKHTFSLLFKKRNDETDHEEYGAIGWLSGKTMLNVSTM